VIKLSEVTKQFEDISPVFKNMSVEFKAGRSYAIKGFSGSGKSTLIHLISGIEKPTSGEISFDGKNLSTLNPQEYSNFLAHSIGLIFQFPYLIKEFTILENVATKALTGEMSDTQSHDRAIELLRSVELEDKADSYPHMLSGGQKQRVSLLRALFFKPKFLLCDELTAHLDEEMSHSILDIIFDFQKKYNMGVIICSHDPIVTDRIENLLEIEDKRLKCVEGR